MTFYCNGKKAFCTESECDDTCDYYNGEGGEYEHELVKLKTNGDRIHAMSDEEYAAFMFAVALCNFRPWCDFHCQTDGDYGCTKCIERWLKKPAEEERR